MNSPALENSLSPAGDDQKDFILGRIRKIGFMEPYSDIVVLNRGRPSEIQLQIKYIEYDTIDDTLN